MKKLKKPKLSVKQIVYDCANSYTEEAKRIRIQSEADYIEKESDNYDLLAKESLLFSISSGYIDKRNISKEEMIALYTDKFVKSKPIRSRYYDKIIVAAHDICPLCCVGHVKTLDHYLPKSQYPIYSVTPVNLVPSCRDCNSKKGDVIISKKSKQPLHPYYDNIDDVIWLKAVLFKKNEGIVVDFFVDETLKNDNLDIYEKALCHFNIYELNSIFAIEASREISENLLSWKKNLAKWGKQEFIDFLNDNILSYEKSQKNTWKTALYRALKENVNIINEIE